MVVLPATHKQRGKRQHLSSSQKEEERMTQTHALKHYPLFLSRCSSLLFLLLFLSPSTFTSSHHHQPHPAQQHLFETVLHQISPFFSFPPSSPSSSPRT
jgi:hypothetical protein